MLTDAAIRNQPVPQKRMEIPDGKIAGLYLVIQPATGAKSWALRYRANGQPKKLTLGAYPGLGIANARTRAQEAIGKIAGGNDPAAAKKAAREVTKAAREAKDTIAVLAEEFVRRAQTKKRGAALAPSWIRERKRLLDKEVIPVIGKKRSGEVTKEDINRILNGLVDRGSATQANRLRAVLHRFFRWAVAQSKTAHNPVEGTEPPGPETARDRVLSDEEMRAAWRAFGVEGWPFGDIAKLLLLTAARREEIGGAQWSDIDLAARTWMVPTSRSKNDDPHVIPLSDAAVKIIESLKRVEPKRDDKGIPRPAYVFTTTGKSSVSGWGRAKNRIDLAMAQALEKVPLEWVIHDLRRTADTGMARLGIAPHVVEAVLNHRTGTIKGVGRVYNRYSYEQEKRSALDAWARHVETVVGERKEESNVTPMQMAAP